MILFGSEVLGALRHEAIATSIQRSALAAIAIERFRLAEGKLPQELNELVPAYVAEVPADPFATEPLCYRPDGQTYLIYSRFLNRRDDGGAGIRQNLPKDFGLWIRPVAKEE
jgi:hypothetical protein